MDGRTFDSLTRSLSVVTAARRQTIRGIVGAALGLSLGQSAHLAADARKKKNRKKKKRKNKQPPPPACTPQCDGRACGADGCGDRCGDCDDGESCTDIASGSICQPGVCTPDCSGKECGPDGCGDFCGACSGNETCAGGVCQCTPNCSGKVCGANGCGGSCGSCPEGQSCDGGACQCASGNCGGACCTGNQSCISGECWPDSEESAFVTLINNHRAANGLGPLGLQNQLSRAAELHSQDQASTGNSSHTGTDGSTPDARITAAGYSYSWWGENIYYGGGTASAAFDWWKNSPGHNANMLSTNFEDIGIGRAYGNAAGQWFWTTTFGSQV